MSTQHTIKDRMKQYKVAPVLWINLHAQYNEILYLDCVAVYEGTEHQFYIDPDTVLRKYRLVGIRDGGYD